MLCAVPSSSSEESNCLWINGTGVDDVWGLGAGLATVGGLLVVNDGVGDGGAGGAGGRISLLG